MFNEILKMPRTGLEQLTLLNINIHYFNNNQLLIKANCFIMFLVVHLCLQNVVPMLYPIRLSLYRISTLSRVNLIKWHQLKR